MSDLIVYLTLKGGIFMDIQKVDTFMMANQNKFDPAQLQLVREKLLSLDDARFNMIMAAELKDPTTALILSICLGGLGVDRFYIGDVGLGVLKLLTAGVCGIMAIVDWCIIMSKTREKNFETIMSIC